MKIWKRIISCVLAFALAVTAMPAGQLVTLAAPAVDEATTATNVATVQQYADDLLTANTKTDSYANGGFTWDSTNATTSWKYYNGMMLDAYTMLGDVLSEKTESYYQFVKDFYDKGNLTEDGTPVNYADKELESVPMGLALFDLLEENVAEEEDNTLTDEEIAALEATPFSVKEGLFDQSIIDEDLGLSAYINNATNVFSPDTSKFTNTFANGVVMTEYNGNLYCMWQSSQMCEDTEDTKIAYSISEDGGVTWNEVPMFLPNTNLTNGYCSSGGWHVDTVNNRLIAYINYWPSDLNPKGGYTYYTASTDGINWSTPQPVLMEDGSQLNGVFEQDPHILDNGRIVNFAHFQKEDTDGNSTGGLYLNPIYTDDKTGVKGWKKSEYTYLSQSNTSATQSRDLEPSMYVNKYGHLVMVARDQDSTFTVLSSISTDNGETWSDIVQITDMPDARQKQSAGNLPDGTAYIVSCPVNNKNRYPLVITLSEDGKTFTKAYVLGSSTNSKLGNVKYPYQYENGTYEENGAVSYKRAGYHYPKSTVIGDYLYVSYSVNKEIVEYIKIPVNALSLNDATESNKNLISLTDENSTYSEWELDYNLQEGDLIFVDRPSVNDGTPLQKYFNRSDQSVSGVLPTELIGSVYIRTANDDKLFGNTSTKLASIAANQDVDIYIGFDSEYIAGKGIPEWVSKEGFNTTAENFTYQANDAPKYYRFYKKEVRIVEDDTVDFYSQENSKWHYIAMVVPVEDTSSDKYRDTINYIYNELTSSDFSKLSDLGGNYSELNDSEVTLADVYMAQRFLIECANAVNNGKLALTDVNGNSVGADTIYNDVYTSLKWIGENLYNTETGLYYKGYNIANAAVTSTYEVKNIGFYAMTLVDTIAMLPSSQTAKKSELTAYLKRVLDGMLTYQDAKDANGVEATGLWTNAVTTGTDYNYEASSMLSYAYLKAFGEGILSDDKYNIAGLKAFNGIVESGWMNTSTVSEEANEEYSTGVAPLLMASTYAVGIDDTIYLNGTLSYSIYENEELTENDIKTSAFINVINPDGEAVRMDLTSDGVSCVWNKTFTTETPGTYVMSVIYNDEPIGQVTVDVKELDSAWVDVETDTLKGTYEVVYSMDSNNKDGYLITRKGVQTGSKHSLCVSSGENAPFDTVVAVDFIAYNEDTDNEYRYAIVDFEDVNNNNRWFIDEDDHIYSVDSNGNKYYLDIDSTNQYVKYTNDSTKAPYWTFSKASGTDSNIISGSYYLNNTGTKNKASDDINNKIEGEGNFKFNDSGTVIIWCPEYEEGKAALSGTTIYNVLVGDSSVNVSTIQRNAYVLLKKNKLVDYTPSEEISGYGEIIFDWTTPEKLPWSDPNISFTWNQPFDTNVAGTYVMTVMYNDVAVGSITVNVGDVTWTDITDYKYERTTTLTAGQAYIITDSANDASINQESATTIKHLTTGIDGNNPKNSWSSPQDVNITASSDGYYYITGANGSTVSDASMWNYDESGHLYTTVNGRSYYILGTNASNDSNSKQISVNTTYSWAAAWSAADSGDNNKTNLKTTYTVTTTTDETTTETEVTRYLNYTSRNLFQSVEATEGEAPPTVTIYTPVKTSKLEMGMAGEDEYTVVANNNTMSETFVKAETNFYLKTTNTDGTSNIERIPWSELTYVWTAVDSDGNILTDENGAAITALDANKKGIYTMTVSYQGKDVGTVTVNVKEIQDVSYDGKWWMGVGLGQIPNFSEEKLKVTYTDGTVEYVTIVEGVEISGYDTSVAGTQKASLSYMGYTFENVLTIEVWDDPYAGLEDATTYPEYPEDGAVRINKTATNETDVPWYDTGVTKVELDVAGTSVRSGVDVILVSDISNSMGRYSADNSQLGEKLNESMDAASKLAEILLADGNKNNNSISFVTFGGFDLDNCSDKIKEGSYQYVIENPEVEGYSATDKKLVENPVGKLDSTQTVFVYEQDLTKAQNSFNGTLFLSRKDNIGLSSTDTTGDNDIVQITDNEGNVSIGWNNGGTNYDYAFAEAKNAIAELKSAYAKANGNQSYDASGRKIVLLFMTDGAPTYYNYEGVQLFEESESNPYLYGTKIIYPESRNEFYAGVSTKDSDEAVNYTEILNGESVTKTAKEWWEIRSANWLKFTDNPNAYAVELNSLVDAFYAVGFKMSEDLGVSKHCIGWSVDSFTNVLAGVAGVENGKQAVDGVIVAEDVTALTNAYIEMTEQVSNAGTYAKVYDEIKSEFTLLMDDTIRKLDGTDTNVAPKIEVIKYNLNTSGERTGESQCLESVWFEVDSNNNISAYSDQIYTESDGVKTYTNILVDSDTTDNYYQLAGKNFTYTYNNGWEYFEWNIQTIAGYEYALSYYAYLEGTNKNYEESTYNERGNGVYNTNEKASLTYVDINETKAVQDFPVPNRPWGAAVTTVEYYLVNDKGQPVNRAGEVVPFENRIIISDATHHHEFNIGDEENDESVTIRGEEHAPNGYVMYNKDASYKVEVNIYEGGTVSGSLDISDTVYVKDSNGNDTADVSTKRVDNNGNNYEATKVAFGVLSSNKSSVTFKNDKIVIDYGKTIQVDVLANDGLTNWGQMDVDGGKYSVTLSGVTSFVEDSNATQYIQGSSGSVSGIYTSGGEFRIVEGTSLVQFVPCGIVSEVQRVFAVVKLTNVINSSDYYFMYQELDVIPATNVYYETDFIENNWGAGNKADVFTKTQADTTYAWVEKYDSDEKELATDEAGKVTESSQISSTENGSDNVQQDGRLTGAGRTEAHTYGYDPTYTDDNLLSDGSSYFVEGKGTNKNKNTTVEFSFKGTGIDIYSRTGIYQGMIRVNIMKQGETEVFKKVSVLNKSESDWGELYQIPVISIEELPYGEYDVLIEVFDKATYSGALEALSRDNDFYFDAVRIYNPLGVSDSDGVLSGDTENIGADAYKTDGEYSPFITEVRDWLIDAKDFDTDGTNMNNGVVFIERWGQDKDNTSESESHNYQIASYEGIGPNNELYLAANQAVVFKLKGINTDSIASIDIGAKSVDGTPVKLKATIANAVGNISDSNGTKNAYTIETDIKSCSSQYYQLYGAEIDTTIALSSFAKEDTSSNIGYAYIYISNACGTGNDGTVETGASVLSITDMKVAYSAYPEGTYSLQYESSEELLAFADNCLSLTPDYDVETAAFTEQQARIFGSVEMVVETSQYVQYLEITDRFGRPMDAAMEYEDLSNGLRRWTIVLTVTKLGEQSYRVTGYSNEDVAGEQQIAKINVTTNEEGGYQDAKSIYKTLFNCRILSIKRNGGNKLYSGSR